MESSKLTPTEEEELKKWLDQNRKKEFHSLNENHLAIAFFLLGALAILGGVLAPWQIFRSYMEQLADVGMFHVIISMFFALFGTTKVNIVEKILDNSLGVAVFMCGYAIALGVIIAG